MVLKSRQRSLFTAGGGEAPSRSAEVRGGRLKTKQRSADKGVLSVVAVTIVAAAVKQWFSQGSTSRQAGPVQYDSRMLNAYFHAATVPAPTTSRSQRIQIARVFNLSWDDYLERYDAREPVVLLDALKDSPCMREWTPEWLMDRYGDARVAISVQDNRDSDTIAATLRFFMERGVEVASPDRWAYASDETFGKRYPEIMKMCPPLPLFARQDFFPKLPKGLREINSLFLFGTKHSKSSVHVDPYNWTGSNAVTYGLKRWILLPPGRHDHLLSPVLTESGFPLNSVKYHVSEEVDFFTSSGLRLLRKIWREYGVSAYVADVRAGEALIIPSGWWHQAYNAEMTIAMAGQVCNAGNFRSMLKETIVLHENDTWKWPLFDDGGVFTVRGRVNETLAEHVFNDFVSSIPAEITRFGAEKSARDISQIEGK
eukprot:TRINITY_DN4556_c1_g1_i1.p1 TRINITY_DN4556_c1_g1~~TRINITY_DN4556_c1_g1_i1.p1  ORF type:complete len:426 (-),score=65.66 TRINITY_DN4556_c1_g1_i1:16-1293(-)